MANIDVGLGSSTDGGDASSSIIVEIPNNMNITSSMNNRPNPNIVVISNRYESNDASDEPFFHETSSNVSSCVFYNEITMKSIDGDQTNNVISASQGN